jgi:hypothetical protein
MSRELHELDRPVVVVAFDGWNDAAQAATSALSWLTEKYSCEVVDEIDDEQYFDFVFTRPKVSGFGDEREMVWPSVRFATGKTPKGDLLVIEGPEPNLRWRSFTGEVLGRLFVARPKMVILLGAMLADVPHTRSLPLNGSATDPEIDVTLATSDYEGPTGILGVLSAASQVLSNCTVVSLWVSVPHYAVGANSPKATLALLSQVTKLMGVEPDLSELSVAASEWESQITDLVDDDPDISDYVGELEDGWDSDPMATATGETIAAELQKFLSGPSA